MNSNKNRFDASNLLKSLGLGTLASGLLWTAPLVHANWETSQELGIGIGYDDNAELADSPGSSSSESYFGVNASATFSYVTPRTDFELTPALSSKRFSEDSDLDSDDLFLLFNYKRIGVKTNFLFYGNMAREAVRTAERLLVDFDVQDPDDIDTDSSGVRVSTGDRERLILSPVFNYKMSPRYSLSISGAYQDTSYDERASDFLTDFRAYSGGVALLYNWSEKDVIRLDARASNYEAGQRGSDARGSQFGIGYDRWLTERTQLKLLFAGNNTEDVNGKDVFNPTGEISVVHRALLTNAFASYRQTVTGSGAGNQAVYDILNLSVSRQLTPKLTLSGGAYAYVTDPLESNIQEIDYSQLRASASWRLRRSVTLELQYAFTHIKSTLGDVVDNEDSNEISLWFYWSPNPLSR